MARGLVKPAPPTLPQAELRRRAILDATLRVIADGGVDAVTHRRVAAEADVALGSTTYYFASREELVREAFRHYLAEVTVALASLERENPIERPADIAEALTDLARREFAAPTLVLWTTHDPTASVAVGEELAAAIPGSQFVVMEDCGHWPQFEDPETFNRIHIDFLLGRG